MGINSKIVNKHSCVPDLSAESGADEKAPNIGAFSYVLDITKKCCVNRVRGFVWSWLSLTPPYIDNIVRKSWYLT